MCHWLYLGFCRVCCFLDVKAGLFLLDGILLLLILLIISLGDVRVSELPLADDVLVAGIRDLHALRVRVIRDRLVTLLLDPLEALLRLAVDVIRRYNK